MNIKLYQYALIVLLSCKSLHAALRTNDSLSVPEYNALIDRQTAYRVAQKKEKKELFLNMYMRKGSGKFLKKI